MHPDAALKNRFPTFLYKKRKKGAKILKNITTTRTPLPFPQSHPHLRNNIRPDNPDGFRQHRAAAHDRDPRLLHSGRGDHAQPDGVEGDGEEVVEEHEGLSDDARQQANGAVDASAAELEVAEAAELESLQVGVWDGSVSRRFGGRGVVGRLGWFTREERGDCVE